MADRSVYSDVQETVCEAEQPQTLSALSVLKSEASARSRDAELLIAREAFLEMDEHASGALSRFELVRNFRSSEKVREKLMPLLRTSRGDINADLSMGDFNVQVENLQSILPCEACNLFQR